MKNALIVTGGYINFDRIKIDTDKFDLIIAADSGYLSAQKLNLKADIIVGDFDSAKLPTTDAKLIKLPAEKDDTDTMMACKIAEENRCKNILLIGGTGGRADHFLSNVFLLEAFKDKDINITLTDGENKIYVLKNETAKVENNRGYFSVFALNDCIVTLENCKYPLKNYTLTRKNPSFAVSNEVYGEYATVIVQGKAIICETIK